MVEEGVAVTVEPTVEDSEVAGVQVYVAAPLAVSAAEVPAQIVAPPTDNDPADLTVTVVEAVSLHPFASVAITEYVVFAVGLTTSEVPEPLAPAGLLYQE